MVSIAAVSMLSGFSVYCKVIVWLPADPLGLKSHAQYTVGSYCRIPVPVRQCPV